MVKILRDPMETNRFHWTDKFSIIVRYLEKYFVLSICGSNKVFNLTPVDPFVQYQIESTGLTSFVLLH